MYAQLSGTYRKLTMDIILFLFGCCVWQQLVTGKDLGTPRGYSHRVGDCVGNYDISKITETTVAECAKTCSLVGHCKSFIYNSRGSYCWLKDNECPQLTSEGTTNFHFYTKTGLTGPSRAPTVEGANIALGKPTLQFDRAFYGDASRAVDGNKDQQFISDSCTHTSGRSDTSTNNWWAVDLETKRDVRTVVLYNRADCCGERLANFDIVVTNQEPTPGQKLQYTQSEVCAHQGPPVQQGGTATFTCTNRIGRYVAVVQPSKLPLTLCEVEVFDHAITQTGVTPTPGMPGPPGTTPTKEKDCKDSHNSCDNWAKIGECQKNPNWMLVNCQKSCNSCTTGPKATTVRPRPTPGVVVNAGPTMRVGVFVTPDALRVWQTTKQGSFATFKSSMQGTAQTEISGVFRTSEGFPWNVDVNFVSVEMASQRQVNQWMSAMRRTGNPSEMASDFCKYVNGVKGSRYDIGMLIISKAERDNNGLPPGASASIGTICKPPEQNVNCLFVYAQTETWREVPLWHMLLAHELGHLLGGWHPRQTYCEDIMANPNIKSPNGKPWGPCSTKEIRKVQSTGGLRCLGL
ncbi:uncharacterized protein LOC135491202 [Lineus longissimus]|uniref:uncharacterized protein LOC135491202 n=1 Tax=Lineus longissimus TaxID=88925 RepID=UPI002B4FA4AA